MSNTTMRLLVVDDLAGRPPAVTALLERSPPTISFDHVPSPVVARELVRVGGHDAILLDAGDASATLDFLSESRAAGVDTPILVLMSRDDEQIAVEAMKAGATDYLVKHRLTPELLVASLRYAVERRARERLARQAQDTLRASEEHLRELADVTKDTTWSLDVRTGACSFTEGFELAFGWPVREVPDAHAWYSERVHADDRARVLDDFRAVLSGDRTTWWAEYRLRRADGGYSHVLDRAFVVRDPSGAPQRVVGSIIDMSARARREEDQRQSQRLEALGRLAGGVAHDFNNLLTAIIGYAELLSPQVAPGPQQRAVEQIREAGRRAAALTHQLLAFSRKQVLQPEVLDPSRVVASMRDLLRRLIREDIDIAFELSAAVGRVRVDRAQLEQVILNLALNARDAMPQGGRLVISTRPTTDDPPRVRLEVTDTGCGMPQDVLDHVFEPFFTTKGPGKGTGLGLATVYGIVTQSGGQITARSAVGAGTTFEITLPVCGEAPEPSSGSHRTPRKPTYGGRETVLVVEDEDAVRQLVREVLTASGYEVLEAARGDEALRLATAIDRPLHLVISDVVLPGMSGHELVTRLSALLPDVRVLFMSGYTGEPGTGVAVDAGPLLEKPFTPERLTAIVRATLDAAAVG